MTYDIIILGSGPAGLAAAIAARGRDKSVLVIGNPWQDSPLAKAERVDNYPGLPGRTGLELLEGGRACRITLREGKYHQVKRMLEARGAPVTALKRLSMGPLVLDEALKPGQWRELTQGERTALLALK